MNVPPPEFVVEANGLRRLRPPVYDAVRVHRRSGGGRYLSLYTGDIEHQRLDLTREEAAHLSALLDPDK